MNECSSRVRAARGLVARQDDVLPHLVCGHDASRKSPRRAFLFGRCALNRPYSLPAVFQAVAANTTGLFELVLPLQTPPYRGRDYRSRTAEDLACVDNRNLVMCRTFHERGTLTKQLQERLLKEVPGFAAMVGLDDAKHHAEL